MRVNQMVRINGNCWIERKIDRKRKEQESTEAISGLEIYFSLTRHPYNISKYMMHTYYKKCYIMS